MSPRSLLGSLSGAALVAACHHAAPPPPGNVGAPAAAPLVAPSFWEDHPRASASRPCAAADYRAVATGPGAPPAERAAAWAKLAATCWLDWHGDGDAIDPSGLDAYLAFAGALLDAGHPHDCEALLADLTTPYPGGLDASEVPEELTERAEAVAALGERCADAAEAELTGFAAPTCPGDACLALVAPADAGEDDAEAGEDGAADEDGDGFDDVACPEVEQRTAAGARRLTAADGPLVDGSFCCGIDAITTTVHAGHRYVLVRPSGADSMYIRACGGGTASATPVGVYRVDGDRLVLEADRSLLWH